MKEIIPRERRECYASEGQRRTLLQLFRVPFVRENFFLTGGTCLSVFYLGHRNSDDLDLFLLRETNLLDHARHLRVSAGAERVLAETPGYCSYICEGGVRVDFVWDRFSGGGSVYDISGDESADHGAELVGGHIGDPLPQVRVKPNRRVTEPRIGFRTPTRPGKRQPDSSEGRKSRFSPTRQSP
jgi:hypothetical protein